MMLLMVLFCI